ncbi:Diacylglycerol kinase [hydrothermal vent metagenome]|uniref:Diacylglycerol kinase n=1 Tax=hydrothermal vent metagenome TaxID=652676 RepID=A0A3B0Z6U9_9ZZZZ
MKNRQFSERFAFAFSGIVMAWRGEQSFRSQLILALVMLPVMLWLQPTLLWWGVMIMMGALILAAELFNTALEQMIDHLHPEIHPNIKVAKDCAAGAVLLLSVAAIVVSICMILDTV